MMDLIATAHCAAPLIVVEPRLAYPGLHGGSAQCAFAFLRQPSDRVVYGLVVELEANPSTSVTNAAEALHAAVRQCVAPWLAPEGGTEAATLVCFEAYEYRIHTRRYAGITDFADPWTTTVTVGAHGAAIWGTPAAPHWPIIEALTRALVAQAAIAPEYAEAARAA